MLDDVTSLDQIKWIFDGRKVTQRQLTENITRAIEVWEIPHTITEKLGISKKELKSNILDNLDTIFKVD